VYKSVCMSECGCIRVYSCESVCMSGCECIKVGVYRGVKVCVWTIVNFKSVCVCVCVRERE